jgi:hypothetical protein
MNRSIYYLDNYTDIKEYSGFVWSGSTPSLFGNANIEEDFELTYRESDGLWVPSVIGDKWKKISVFHDRDKVHEWNDYPMVSYTPAFSKRAMDCLHDLLEPHGEILPVSSEDGDYFAYNCTTHIDVLDFERSVFFHSYLDDSELMDTYGVDKYEFTLSDDQIEELPFFRINRFDLYYFVNHRFVERIQEYSLNGFMPIKIWPFSDDVSWKESYREAMGRSQSAAAKRRKSRMSETDAIPPLEPLEFLTL